MSPPEETVTTGNNSSVADGPQKVVLPITPFETYPKARAAPKELIGVEAALHAAKNPDFQAVSTIAGQFSLKDKVAIVTGGNSGIGLEYSVVLAELGAIVYVLDLPEAPSEDYAACKAYIKKLATGGSLEYRVANVTDGPGMAKVTHEIAETHGRLDVCIANAGILGPVVDCHEYPADWFRKIMEVNVTGVFLTAQAAIKEMLERKIKGSVIFTASMSGSIINKDMHWIPYTTAKAAVVQLAKAFACEVGTNEIRVNCISPGHIRTRMTEAYLGVEPLIENCWAAQNPMNRLGSVYELRGTVAYLASDASTYTTGHDLQVCGGHTAW
ncbi:Sps19p [Sugiyamaella lignohabitans]|uniref:Sps19p n=1 Tax=Sugiyamaella lignohabitans TaxID=796027 RepID=A0A167F1G7_9ASCO|nr:Sps19p [Sugiyamaella lignohabitans]ANB14703.1 Sps19p [Sugiyamaella lignohabitans]